MSHSPGFRGMFRFARHWLPSVAASFFVVLICGAAAASALHLPRPIATQTTAPPSISDDDGGAALLTATNMAPGDVLVDCVRVTVDAGAPAIVAVGATLTSAGLDEDLEVRLEAGVGGRHGDCTGFSGTPIYEGSLADFVRRHPDHASLDAWTADTDGEQRTFRLSVRLRGESVLQGRSATARLAWSARSAPSSPAVTPAPAFPTPAPGVPAPSPAPTASVPAPRTPTPAPVPESAPDAPDDRVVPDPLPPAPPKSSVGTDGLTPGSTPPAASGSSPDAGPGATDAPTNPPPQPKPKGSPAPERTTAPNAVQGAGGYGRGRRSDPAGSEGDAAVAEATAAGSDDGSDDNLVARAAAGIADAAKAAARAVKPAAQRAAFPAFLLVLVGLFLATQSRIDGRDPKLALAPVHHSPDLPFEPFPPDPEAVL